MSNHNLFTLSAEGAVIPASRETILIAARQVLAHRVRRGASLQSPQKTGEYLAARLGHLDYEVFGLILLDKRHRVIECIDLFRGTIDGASVHPREIVKLALLKSAAACIAYHNHPSGVKEQSQADELITARMKEALALIDVRLVDHLLGGFWFVTATMDLRESPGYLSSTCRGAEVVTDPEKFSFACC
jgi:DNA repair protein RadC